MSDKVYVTLPANKIEAHKNAQGEEFFKAYFPEGFKIGDVDVSGKFYSPKFVNPSQYYAGCKTFSVLDSQDKSVWVREDAIGEDGKRAGTTPASDELKFTPAQLADAARAYEEENKVFIRVPVTEFEGGNKNINMRTTTGENPREFFSIAAPYNQPKDISVKGMSWTAPSASGPKEFDGVECYHILSLKGAEILMSSPGDDKRTPVPVAALNQAYWADFKHKADAAAKEVADKGAHAHESTEEKNSSETVQDTPEKDAAELTDAPHMAPGTYNPQFETPEGRQAR